MQQLDDLMGDASKYLSPEQIAEALAEAREAIPEHPETA